LIFAFSEAIDLSLALRTALDREFPHVTLNIALLLLEIFDLCDGIFSVSASSVGAGLLELSASVF
jgi:hypothetical protein